MQTHKSLKLARLAVLVCFVATGCVSVDPSLVVVPENREHRVTVSTDNKILEDPEQKLVHRIDLSSVSLPNSSTELPFRFLLVNDRKGKSIGLKLRDKPGHKANNVFGLRADDLVKVVNRVGVGSPQEIDMFLQSLKSEGKASLVFERGGQTYKFFYNLRNS